MSKYSFTLSGQREWCEDFVRFCTRDPAIHGFFYFNPDWIPRPYHSEREYHLDSNSMFTMSETTKPALQAFERLAEGHSGD